MATIERIQLDPTAPPERLPYDAVWVVVSKASRPIKDEFLKWLDWRSLGQLSRAIGRPGEVPTYVALGPEMPVRWLMVDRSEPMDADSLYKACGSLGLERMLVVSDDAATLAQCSDALTGSVAAKAASSVYVAVAGEAS